MPQPDLKVSPPRALPPATPTNWQVSSTGAGASFNVLTMAPQVAQPYFQTMTYLGRR